MKLKSFRIKNFRSIKDSGECELASDLTVLAGKNEAGKTNVLLALERFNYGDDYDFIDEDAPLTFEGEPKVTVTFTADPEELEGLASSLGLTMEGDVEAIASIPMIITKSFDDSYTFESPRGSFTSLLDKVREENDQQRQRFREKLAEIKSAISGLELAVPLLDDATPIGPPKVEELGQQFEAAAGALTPEQRQAITELLAELAELGRTYSESIRRNTQVKTGFLKSLPFFALFDSFDKEEMLKYEIELEEAKTNKAVANYCAISGLDIQEVIDTTDTQLRRKLVGEKSAVIEGDFGEYWDQDEIHLIVQTNGDNLLFGIKEQGSLIDFKVEQRSKGLQWFLSFYLLLKAKAREEGVILLVDEPGLFVHAKAQTQILRVLSDLSPSNLCIFSTHSPYLIDADRLDRVRIVLKSDSGTKVHELSAMRGDADTLTPIITAIGLDIALQLPFSEERKNVVLEGISDYSFMQGLIELSDDEVKERAENLSLIACTGADRIPSIVSLLLGWGLDFRVVLDHDEKGKTVREKLLLLQIEDKIVFVSDTEGFCIEDVMTGPEFRQYVLGRPDTYRAGEANSVVIPDARKMVLSRNFLNECRAGNVTLSPETLARFKELFLQISE
jgi:hypothetical protein